VPGNGGGFTPRPSIFTALLEAIAVVLVIYDTSAISTLHELLTAVFDWTLLINNPNHNLITQKLSPTSFSLHKA
jgi:hypothetical protein